MTTLTFRSHAQIEDLQPGECTMHRASNSGPARWWQLWFYVPRETDGQLEDFCVPMNPGGDYSESGPGGRTWGLKQVSPGVWQVSPSINVLNDRDAVAGTHEQPSLWHQTPQIVGVPAHEPWANGAAP